MADAVEEALKRISSHKGIVGIVIINGDGVPIRYYNLLLLIETTELPFNLLLYQKPWRASIRINKFADIMHLNALTRIFLFVAQ